MGRRRTDASVHEHQYHATEAPGVIVPVLPVYLVHWNAVEWCASSARSIMASQGVDVRLFVVDNGNHGHLLRERLPPGVSIISAGWNRGYTGGANLALRDWRARFAETEFCVIGAHDLHVRSGTLARLVSVAQGRSSLGILGPALVRPFESSGGVWTGRSAYYLSRHGRGLVERDWVSGTCLLLRAACIKEIGEFDEVFGSYVEDVDLCLRARHAGWKVGVVQDAVAWGLGSRSQYKQEMIRANTVLLVLKHGGMVDGVAALASLLGWVARSAVETVSVWRPPEQRQVSLQFFRLRTNVLRRCIPLMASLLGRLGPPVLTVQASSPEDEAEDDAN